jgi:predicted kinase
VALGGLPGTGKSTIARRLAARSGGFWLRIDAIEQAIRAAGVLAGDVGPAGYMAAYALAGTNLRLGALVIADSVNPLPVTREAWRRTADGVALVEVEVVCSDPSEHRRRVETREGDVPGLVPPDWEAVLARNYAPRTDKRLVIDTAVTGPDAAAMLVADRVAAARAASRLSPPPALR